MKAAEILKEAAAANDQGKEEFSGGSIRKLAGDASMRRYLRLTRGSETYVMMRVAPFDANAFDFLQVQDLLKARGVTVPEVLAVQGESGAILLEDLGDKTMLLALGEDAAKESKLFEQALNLLIDFHFKTISRDPKVKGYTLAFDVEKLMWEVDFTIEHLYGSYLKKSLAGEAKKELRGQFQKICETLSNEPRVFTHRDYHSRNIMLHKNGEMVAIDFQDARMGTHAYDLASILRDSYYQLADDQVYFFLEYYFRRVSSVDPRLGDWEQFRKIFDLMSIQRNFKAIGSFASFYGNRNDVSYLRYIGTSFENIRRNLSKYPEYAELRKLLFFNYY